jgi:hypothetical protein
VNSTIQIQGTLGKAIIDSFTDKIEGQWVYKIINVRIKDPDDNKQTIEIISDS